MRGGRTWRGTTPVKGRGSGHAESGGETSSMWEGGEMRTYQVELNLNFVHFLSLIVVIKFSCQDFILKVIIFEGIGKLGIVDSEI